MIPFNEYELILTEHALKRFKERWKQANPEAGYQDFAEALKRFFAEAKPWEPPRGYRIERLKEHRTWNAEYWETPEWRIVIVPGRRNDEGKKVLLTVEAKKAEEE